MSIALATVCMATDATRKMPALSALLRSEDFTAAKVKDCPVAFKCLPNPSTDADWLLIVPFPSSSDLK